MRVAVCDSVFKDSVMPMDEEVMPLSVMVGRPELGEDTMVDVRVLKVAGGEELSVVDKLRVG